MPATRVADRAGASRARRLAIFAVILAAQFGVFEAALRLWGSSEAAPAFQGLFSTDSVIGYRLKPGARVHFATSEFAADIAINDAGVRDDQPLGPKPANERRIVILGDSLVLAVQVPLAQTFGKRLEARLNAGGGPIHFRVINAGVQGYGPVEEALLFRDLAETLQPDVVVETLFVGNDAEEAFRSAARLDGERPAAVALHESLTTRLRRAVRRSMVLQILRLRVLSATERFSGGAAPPEPPLQSYAQHPAPRIADGLTVSARAVREIAERAGAQGARTVVALMPARFQVDDADYGRLQEAVTASGGVLVRDAATERFATALTPLSLPVVDLLPPLRAALPGPDLFYQQTVHLTPRGHEVVAAALAAFLEREGLAGAGAR